MGMTTTRYEFIARAEGPIAHHEETMGNLSVFMRKRLMSPTGQVTRVPYITGDCIRHKAREMAVYATLEAAGMLDDPQLTEGALRLLFAGGMVTPKGDASVINLDNYRELVTLFPPLALFGGCVDNRPLPGQLIVDEGNLVCEETLHTAPDWVHGWLAANKVEPQTHRRLLEEATRVRVDPALSPEKVKLLTTDAQVAVNRRQLASGKAHDEGDAKEAEREKSTMMPRSFERIIQGSLFWCGLEARTYTPLEADAFDYTVACLLSDFKIGGKLATGHGRLRFVVGNKIHFLPTAGDLEGMGTGLAGKAGTLFRAHIKEHAQQIREWFGRVAA
jgi:hypothetical protein